MKTVIFWKLMSDSGNDLLKHVCVCVCVCVCVFDFSVIISFNSVYISTFNYYV